MSTITLMRRNNGGARLPMVAFSKSGIRYYDLSNDEAHVIVFVSLCVC